MSPFSHERAWEAPAAIALSIRSTAGTVGPGGDNFMKMGVGSQPEVTPTAPLADVGAHPIRSQTAQASEANASAWETPAVTKLTI